MESLTTLSFHEVATLHAVSGISILHSACITGDVEIVRNILTFSPTIVDTLLALRVPVLSFTSRYNGMMPVDILRHLYSSGSHQGVVDLLSTYVKGLETTPLILVAARMGTIHHFQRILAKDSSAMFHCDKEYCTPLHYAAGYNTVDVLQFLISKGSDLLAKDIRGYKPIHFSAWNGRMENLLYLWETNRNEDDLAPLLHLAVLGGHNATAAALLSLGVNVNVRYSLKNPFEDSSVYCYGATPCMVAALKGHLETFKFLLKSGADVFASRDSFGRTVIMCAVQGGNARIVGKLLSVDVDIRTRCASGRSLLHYARQPQVAKLLIDKGLEVNARDINGRMPLHYAVERGDLDVVKLLISHAADQNAYDEFGFVPLK